MFYQGIKFRVEVSGFPEDLKKEDFESPEKYILETCRGKFKSLCSSLNPDSWDILITGDTVVIDKEGRIIEKPQSEEEHFQFIRSLSGHWHTITTVIIVGTGSKMGNKIVEKTVSTRLYMTELTDNQIRSFVARNPSNR